MRTSLVTRLTAVVAIILAASFAAWVAIVHRTTAATFVEEQLELPALDASAPTAGELRERIEHAYASGGWPAVRQLAADVGARAFLVIDADGRIAASTATDWRQAAVEETPDGGVVLRLRRAEAGRVADVELAATPDALVDASGRTWGRFLRLPTPDDRAAAGGRFATEVWRTAAVWLVAVVVVALVSTAWVLRRSLAPLGRLTRAAEAWRDGHVPAPLPHDGPAEFDGLFDAFNAATEAIGGTERLRRQVIADVAHELRTPLTNLRGQLEALEAGLVGADGEFIGTVQGELQLLERLVDDFQALAIADAGQLRLRPQSLPLRATVEQLLAPLARRAGATWVCEGPADLTVVADEDRIRQVLSNLVDNAVRNRPDGLRLTVVCQEVDGTRASLEVRDNGPGVAAEHRPHIFERFYRADGSRNRATGGAGLGLAIVHALVHAMDGTIAYAVRDGFGATFVITLPRA